MRSADGVTPTITTPEKPDGTPALEDCREKVQDLWLATEECKQQVEDLRLENESLRTSSEAFGALAQRLNDSLQKER